MYRHNFPGRKTERRKGALERLKKQKASDDAHAQYIKAQIAILETKLKGTEQS